MRLSDGSLVEDWTRPAPPLLIPVVIEDPPDPAELLADRIVLAVSELKAALQALPTPQINIAAPDLADVVSAVTAAGPTASAEEVADAVAARLHIPAPESNAPLVDAITAAFEKMDHRLVGLGKPAFGASGPSNISDNPTRRLGVVESITEPVTVTATDLDIRDLALTQDSVRQTQRAMSSYVAAQSSADGTVTAVNVTAPTRIRVLRLDGGSKPSNTPTTFCTVTIALGATNVFVKELQVGEPIGGQVCLEGAAGEDLTVAVTGTGTVQFQIRYETFT